MTKQLFPLIAFTLAALSSVALAGPVTFWQSSPSDSAAIAVSVDQGQLRGALEKNDLLDLIEAGRQLFDTKFTTTDGAGRPLATQATIPTHFKHAREVSFQRTSGPDANRCSSCHNDPVSGGAGDFTVNAFTSEGTESADFDTVDPQFSNERGTNHMFGAGLLELLAREITQELHAQRSQALRDARVSGKPVKVTLASKGIDYGHLTILPNGEMDVTQLDGIDADLTIRPFSQKGVIPSLRMFSLNALNAHHGMQADERFGAAMTGEADFDGDGHIDEVSTGLVSALVAFQATLPPPIAEKFDNADWQQAADRGEKLFTEIGCTSCHMPTLPLKSLTFSDPGPNDTAGTLAAHDVSEPAIYDLALLDWAATLDRNEQGDYLIPLFGDLKRHEIADNKNSHFANELMGQGFVPRNVFMTAELWGVADTAPFGHRGDLTDLPAVILAHGGDATSSRDAFEHQPQAARDDLITFLKTLRMPK